MRPRPRLKSPYPPGDVSLSRKISASLYKAHPMLSLIGFEIFPTTGTLISTLLQHSLSSYTLKLVITERATLCLFQYSNSHFLTWSNFRICHSILTQCLPPPHGDLQNLNSPFSFNPYTPSCSNFFHHWNRVYYLFHQTHQQTRITTNALLVAKFNWYL